MAQKSADIFRNGSNSINLVLCVNSGPGSASEEYRYCENGLKSALRAAPLFRVDSEFVRDEWSPLVNLLASFHKVRPEPSSAMLYTDVSGCEVGSHLPPGQTGSGTV